MSHFTVLVITPTRPAEEELNETLLPWHEYECTGIRRYLQWVDETDKLMEAWKEPDTRWRDKDGAIFDGYEARFYRDPTEEELEKIGPIPGTGGGDGIAWHSKDWGDGKGYRAKVRVEPETLGLVAVQVPKSETYGSLAKFAIEYGGWKPIPKQPGRFGSYTNPNARWDWWSLGGRWSGTLKVKSGRWGIKGKPGLMGAQADRGGVDQCRASDLDYAGMLERDRERVRAAWDAWVGEFIKRAPKLGFGGTPEDAMSQWWPMLANLRATLPDGKWMAEWIEQHPEAVRLRDLCNDSSFWHGVPEGSVSREDAAARTRGFSTFAVVKDGQWYEKGKMGWWAAVHDEKEQGAWDAEFAKLMADLPPDTWLSLVDCHI